MTPHEFLGVLDDAIGVAEHQRQRRRDPILALAGSPTVLDETGTPDPDEPGSYWYSLQQCRAMRERLLAAARDDAGVTP